MFQFSVPGNLYCINSVLCVNIYLGNIEVGCKLVY